MTKHEQYLNLVDELLARGVSPNIATNAALKLVGAEPPTATPSEEEYLPKLIMKGTAAEILRTARKDEPEKFKLINVTIMSSILRSHAKSGDPRVKIQPKSPLSKKAIRFVLDN